MREKNALKPKMSISVVIWSNIVRQQYLLGVTDEQLCEVLGITSRTLYNYRHDPSAMTVRQLQMVLEKMGIEMESLLLA